MYKKYQDLSTGPAQSIMRFDGVGIETSIPFDPANTDYQKFKADVLAGAELQDADGNVMKQEEADTFIATLP